MNLRLGGFATTLAFGLLAFVLPLLLYGLTMPVDVVFEDDGLFLLNGVFLGVEHPPGYPVFTLVHHLFQEFPLGTAAVKGHLLSALFASGACVFVFLVVVELGVGRLVALLGALLFAATEHFWSQAIITQVYTFNCLLFFALTLCVVRLWRDPGNRVLWTLAGAVYGIGLANSWPLMVLAAPAFVVALWPLRYTGSRGFAFGLASLTACVVVPYGWLYLYGISDPAFSFAGPFADFGDFINLVTRRHYAGVDVSSAWGWDDFARFSLWLMADVPRQVSYWGMAAAIIALLGVLPLRFRYWPDVFGDDVRLRRFALFSVFAFLSQSFLLLLFLRNDFSDGSLAVLHPYPLVAYGIVSIWVALGCGAALRWALRISPALLARGTVYVVVFVFGFSAVGFTAVDGWDRVNRRGDDFAVEYSRLVFDALPDEAVLVVNGNYAFPIAYLHFVEGVKPGLRIVDAGGLLYASNYYRLGTYGGPTNLHRAAVRALFQKHAAAEERPIYLALLASDGSKVHDYDHQGLVVRLSPRDGLPLVGEPLDELVREHGEWLASADPLDASSQERVNKLTYSYCGFLFSAMTFGDADSVSFVEQYLARQSENPYCLAGLARVAVHYVGLQLGGEAADAGADSPPEGVDLDRIEVWLDDAERSASGGRYPALLWVSVYNARGQLSILRGDVEGAMDYFALSSSLDSSELNPGSQMMMDFSQLQN